jgi:hypothetical protein
MASSSPFILVDSIVSSVSSYALDPIENDDDDSEEEIQLKLLQLELLTLEAVEIFRVSVDNIDGDGNNSTLLD